MTTAELDAVFQDVFPLRANDDLASLEYVTVFEREGWRFVTARLVIWERDGDNRSVRDIKEQEIAMLPANRELTETRLRVYLQALRFILAQALCHPAAHARLPHELLLFEPLKLAAQTTEAFVKALRVKSRLGPYLPATGRALP